MNSSTSLSVSTCYDFNDVHSEFRGKRQNKKQEQWNRSTHLIECVTVHFGDHGFFVVILLETEVTL